MDPNNKKTCPIPDKKKNFESFDVWGKAQFAMWSNIRYDFELICELTRYRRSAKSCLEILDTVNHYLKNTPEKVFFDGTIKCLKFLIKNNYLNLADLPTLTHDERYLVELLEKYSKRLDITDIISDIEEPTLRAMLLEYPNYISEITKDPLGSHLIAKAMLKNGITDADSLVEKVDNGLNAIEVDKDKNSKEAMKCKIIYLGLFVNNRKISIPRGATHIIHEFETLTDDVVENQTYEKGVFNSLYVALYSQSEWNKERKTHLSGCDTLYLDFQLLMLPDNHMSIIYDLFLSKYVDEIGKKYFGDEYRPEGFIASLAIKMVVVIILFRTEDFLPKDEKRETDIFNAGAFLGGLNYAVRETGDPKNPLELKKWFIDYFCDELDKRVAFIKMQIENKVGIVSMREMLRVIYLPVFESFRFFCDRTGLLNQIIKLLKNKDISNSVKDEIFINFVLNIQKIIANQSTDIPEDEKRLKDIFILLIKEAFDNFVIKLVKSPQYPIKKYYEDKKTKFGQKTSDLESDAILSVIELIMGFDLSKSDSFIAYLTFNLPLKIRTAGRIGKKIDLLTDTESVIEKSNNLEEDEIKESFLNSIPEEKILMEAIENKDNLAKIDEYINKLPEKEKEAVRKMVESNEKLNDTERKAKNRGLNKIREMMGTL